MARIRRDINTPKEELGRIDFEDNTFIFRETHRSKRGTYDVSIKDIFGNYLYTIEMDREQINRIKQNGGISKIDFVSEEGFRAFIEYTYLGGREFNEEQFKQKFIDDFYENFKFLKEEYYSEANENNIIDYIQYLSKFVDSEDLEELYYQNAQVFSTVWKYNKEGYGEEQIENAKNLVYKLDKIKTELEIFLKSKGITFMTKDEFEGKI